MNAKHHTSRTAGTWNEGDEAALAPIDRLMLAVLEDAIMTFQHGLDSPCPTRRKHFHEVGRWIHSRDADSPFAFESVCSALHLDPDYIRAGLARLRRRAVRSASRRPAVRLRRSAATSNEPGPVLVATAG